MNRSIKFRVWDNKSLRFLSENEFALFKNGCLNLKSKTITNPSENTLDQYYFSENRFTIQQFTGLLDKNGRDIYEGDILKEHHYEDWGDEEGFEYVGVVRYRTYSNDAGNQFSGFVTYPNLRENKGYAGTPIKVDCEVIGNIFENPDLLK